MTTATAHNMNHQLTQAQVQARVQARIQAHSTPDPDGIPPHEHDPVPDDLPLPSPPPVEEPLPAPPPIKTAAR
jgi:hypothetical protein